MKPPYATVLEQRRKELGMTQAEFAEHVLGLKHRKSYHDIINGRNAPSYQTIANAWLNGGTDPLAIIGGAPPEGRVRFTIHPPDHVPAAPETCAIARMNIGQWEVRAELTPQRARQLAQELLKLADQKEAMK